MSSATDVCVERPTNVRWLMFLLAGGTSWFLYLHRYVWNFVGPEIKKTYDLDNTQTQFVFSMFYWTYGAGQIPSGIVIDLFGPHLFLGVSIVLWSVALIGFGMTGSLRMIGVFRLLFGAAQAGCYPGLTKATQVWFPLSSRTTLQGWVATTFGRGGGAMSSIIFGTVLLGWLKMPWQTALLVIGIAGIVFGLIFLMLFRNSPVGHPWVNDAERELIVEGATTASTTGTLPWRKAIRSRSLFFCTIQMFLDAGSDLVYVSLIAQYFEQRHHLKIAEVGWLTSLPLWGGALGGIAGGWLNEFLIRTTGQRRWSRCGIGAVGKVIGCGMLYIVSVQPDPVGAGIALMCAKFFSDWSQPTVWGTCTDLGGRYSATVFSIVNTAGTFGLIMPIIFGILLDWNSTRDIVTGKIVETNWSPLFLLVAGMYLACGICWLLIDCTKPLDTES